MVPFLEQHYALHPPVDCCLLRSYTNDVYVVQTADTRFVLKVYGSGWRTRSEIDYEMALLEHLAARGVNVARPVSPAEGNATDFVRFISDENDARFAVLFAYAAGHKPQPAFGTSLYTAFGKAIGAMHRASDDFMTDFARRPLDLPCLIDDPLTVILPLLPTKEARTFLEATADQVRSVLNNASGPPLDWGPIHGDASLDNLHVTANGDIILYDFDSGGPGWRASDLQGWAFGNPPHQEKWQAFRTGYGSLRPLREADLRAAPYLTVAWDIWGISLDLQRRVLKQGAETTQTFLRTSLENLRRRRLP